MNIVTVAATGITQLAIIMLLNNDIPGRFCCIAKAKIKPNTNWRLTTTVVKMIECSRDNQKMLSESKRLKFCKPINWAELLSKLVLVKGQPKAVQKRIERENDHNDYGRQNEEKSFLSFFHYQTPVDFSSVEIPAYGYAPKGKVAGLPMGRNF